MQSLVGLGHIMACPLSLFLLLPHYAVAWLSVPSVLLRVFVVVLLCCCSISCVYSVFQCGNAWLPEVRMLSALQRTPNTP